MKVLLGLYWGYIMALGTSYTRVIMALSLQVAAEIPGNKRRIKAFSSVMRFWDQRQES